MAKKGVNEAIKTLLAAGFTANGETKTVSEKVITQASYPAPGAVITTGGRQRFSKGDRLHATVGPRTICLYYWAGDRTIAATNVKTSIFAPEHISLFEASLILGGAK